MEICLQPRYANGNLAWAEKHNFFVDSVFRRSDVALCLKEPSQKGATGGLHDGQSPS